MKRVLIIGAPSAATSNLVVPFSVESETAVSESGHVR